MRVYFNLDKKNTVKGPMAIALGTFDGIHLGHQILIRQLKLLKKSTGCHTMVYTFLNNPKDLISPHEKPPRLMTINEKIDKFKDFALDYLILNSFDKKLASMEPKEFIENVLIKNYDLDYLVVGYDFRFGSMAKGDTKLLYELSKKYKFELIVVPPVSLDGQIISSSLIRSWIQGDGQMERVSMALGDYYSIGGEVVHGYGRGKKIGFPTANLKFPHKKALPQNGIYLTRSKIQGEDYWGLTNVGVNPTFNNKGIFVETHILDYSGDLYGSQIRTWFFKQIRHEIKFPSMEDLRAQISKDVTLAKNFVYKAKRM